MTEVLRSSQNALGNPDLPIALHRYEIEDSIRDNPVTIVVAPTGSGKTTQIPQYACELTDGSQSLFNEIIVTQPRIVAARAVSERVGQEIADAGQEYAVGYYTSKEKTDAPQRDQDIAFLTDGKAAVQLLYERNETGLEAKRLLIIDEVHEWNLNIEQLIAIAVDKTDPASPHYDKHMTVVIMSATMDADGLRNHFKHCAPPVIEVAVPTYPIESSVSDKSVASVSLSLAAENSDKVIAFTPGKREIHRLSAAAAKQQEKAKLPIPVIPLHGQQNAHQQSKAFDDYPQGAVIATTNAAETSLTVPGAYAVVDSGEVRVDEVSYDQIPTGNNGLYLRPASQANLQQRRGRIGRTRPGKYVLASPDGKKPPTPIDERPQFAAPSIEREQLDNLMLRIKAVGSQLNDFRFFHQPPTQAISAAEMRLRNIGATDANGDITERGQVINGLPLDIEYACMIAFAKEKNYSTGVQQNIFDIAAIMQLGGILKRAPKEQKWRELLASDLYGQPLETDSDFFAQLEAYVSLVNTIDRKDWGKYDIIEYSADLVEDARTHLAEKMGVELHEPLIISSENRQAVLTAINAGQLSQLWQQNGEQWKLVLDNSEGFSQSESSVARSIGRYATGSLFSLGLGHETIHSIQDVNKVISADSLEQAAGHLVKDKKVGQVTFNAERGEFVQTISRNLGNIALRTFEIPIDVDPALPEAPELSKAYNEHAWTEWSKLRDERPMPYNAQSLATVLDNPESEIYGVDPITQEPLIAWKGGKGEMLRSKEAALASLEARVHKLARQPEELLRAKLKLAIKEATADLRAYKKRNNTIAEAGDTLLKNKNPSLDWLTQVGELIVSAGEKPGKWHELTLANNTGAQEQAVIKVPDQKLHTNLKPKVKQAAADIRAQMKRDSVLHEAGKELLRTKGNTQEWLAQAGEFFMAAGVDRPSWYDSVQSVD